jgi:hypothetical protein
MSTTSIPPEEKPLPPIPLQLREPTSLPPQPYQPAVPLRPLSRLTHTSHSNRHQCWMPVTIHQCNHTTLPAPANVMHRLECPGPQNGKNFCDYMGEEVFYVYVKILGRCIKCEENRAEGKLGGLFCL